MRLAPGARRLGALLTFAAITLAGFTLAAPDAHADDTVGIAIAPVNAKGETDGRSRFSYQAAPGQKVSDHVKVTNAGTTSLKVTVFATEAYNDEKGDFSLKPSDQKASGAAGWVNFDGRPQLTLILKRGESRTVAFTVDIPKDATPGDHPAGVIASATTEGQVTVERRIADRLYVRVAGDLQPNLTISSFTAGYRSGLNPFDGATRVTATITNTGNVALEGTTTVTGTTWFGIPVGQLSRAELPEILPGNTTTVSYDLKGVPQVGYAVTRMLLQSGISGDAPDPGPLPVVQRDAFVLALPWVPLGVIVLGVGGWFLWRWYRAREDRLNLEWAEQTEADALRQAEENLAARTSATDSATPEAVASEPQGRESR